MGKYTRRYQKWARNTTDDCSCIYCLYYQGKKRPCPLEVCCCAEEREEAFRREQKTMKSGVVKNIDKAGRISAPREEECHAGCKQRAS